MNDKMREEFEKWARTECFDLTSLDGFYSDNEAHIAWGAWQAAQSVPVVGEVVGYLAGGTMMRRQIQGYECKPLIVHHPLHPDPQPVGAHTREHGPYPSRYEPCSRFQ